MPRHPRVAPGGQVYHVLNRTVGRMKMFRKPADYDAFLRVLLLAHQRHPIPILAFCLMPSHWHFVVHPQRDGQLTPFFQWLTHTHAMRWRTSHNTVGYGHLYQDRFKSFPVQRDEHLLILLRYVERNPLSANLVRRAQAWPYSSLSIRSSEKPDLQAMLSPWPVDLPRNWLDHVNQPLTGNELDRIRLSLHRSRPFGDDTWTLSTATRLHLDHTLRPPGRPKNNPQRKKTSPGKKTSPVPVS
jgi:putative transposase